VVDDRAEPVAAGHQNSSWPQSALPRKSYSSSVVGAITDAARAYLYSVARDIQDGAPEAAIGVLALKAAASEMAATVSELCMRVGGGAAYAKQGPLERHFRDARAASVMAPTTELLHDFLGKALCGQEVF